MQNLLLEKKISIRSGKLWAFEIFRISHTTKNLLGFYTIILFSWAREIFVVEAGGSIFGPNLEAAELSSCSFFEKLKTHDCYARFKIHFLFLIEIKIYS